LITPKGEEEEEKKEAIEASVDKIMNSEDFRKLLEGKSPNDRKHVMDTVRLLSSTANSSNGPFLMLSLYANQRLYPKENPRPKNYLYNDIFYLLGRLFQIYNDQEKKFFKECSVEMEELKEEI